MWTIAADILSWVISLFGFGKPDPIKQGEALGKAETQASDYCGELDAIQKAQDARSRVFDDPASIVSDPENIGPGKP